MQGGALRLVYKNISSSLNELSGKKYFHNSSERYLKLATEMCKVKHKTAPKLMCELFQETEHPYNLRNDHTTFRTYNVKTVKYGTETVIYET